MKAFHFSFLVSLEVGIHTLKLNIFCWIYLILINVYIYTDRSDKDSKETLWRFPELSVYEALSSAGLYPSDSSHLGFLKLHTLYSTQQDSTLPPCAVTWTCSLGSELGPSWGSFHFFLSVRDHCFVLPVFLWL